MRNRWAKLLILLLGLSLLASLTVSYAYADVDADGSTSSVQPAVTSSESNEVPAVEETPDDVPALTAPAGVLPGYVFVVGNREIVLERPTIVTNEPQATSEDSSHSESDSCTGSVTARATAASARVIVVDENDRVIQVWSNTTGTKRGYYSLRVREDTFQGPEHPLTREILEQYNRLLGPVDWTVCGRAY